MPPRLDHAESRGATPNGTGGIDTDLALYQEDPRESAPLVLRVPSAAVGLDATARNVRRPAEAISLLVSQRDSTEGHAVMARELEAQVDEQTAGDSGGDARVHD
jgi:hypothetical protein